MKNLPSIEEMLKAGMHFGHRTSRWHPKMAPFIFGQRNGVHIIDLMKSQQYLKTALEYMKQAASQDKIILFVGTKSQAKEHIKKAALDADMPYVNGKWLGGCLTNFSVIKRLIKKYEKLVDEKKTGKLSKYTKKEQLEFDREIEKLESKVGGMTKLTRLPDLVFVWGVKEESNAILEAKKKNIPVVGVCDTNVNPKNVNYIIPSNDDATKTIKMLLGLVSNTIKEGKANKSNK